MSYVCKLCTCTGMRLANNEKESPLMYMYVYTMVVLTAMSTWNEAPTLSTKAVSYIGGDATQVGPLWF